VHENHPPSAPLRIGIKYCGGCNPDYDRGSLVEMLKEALSSTAVLVHWEEDDPDVIVAVQGCPTACADLGMFDASKVLSVTSTEDFASLVETINRRQRSLKRAPTHPA
jgi:hypothetical protein